MHPRTYMHIEKPVCVQFPGTVEEEMFQKWTKRLCAFPSWLLSYRIWSLCRWLLRVLCSLAFGRVLTDSIYLVTSEQNWTQLNKGICVASGVVAKSYKLQFPGINLVSWMPFSSVSLPQVWGQLFVAFPCLSSFSVFSDEILTFILKLTSIPFPFDRWLAPFPPGAREKKVR